MAAVIDRTNTTGTVWLGLTVGCAQCHDHKYDSFSQEEYYQLFDFFNNGDERRTRVPISDAAVARHEREKAEHDAKILALRKRLATRREVVSRELPGREQALREIAARLGLSLDR